MTNTSARILAKGFSYIFSNTAFLRSSNPVDWRWVPYKYVFTWRDFRSLCGTCSQKVFISSSISLLIFLTSVWKMIRGSDSWALMGWTISFTTLTTIAIVLRFWSAKIQKRRIFVDDGFVVASYVSNRICLRQPDPDGPRLTLVASK